MAISSSVKVGSRPQSWSWTTKENQRSAVSLHWCCLMGQQRTAFPGPIFQLGGPCSSVPRWKRGGWREAGGPLSCSVQEAAPFSTHNQHGHQEVLLGHLGVGENAFQDGGHVGHVLLPQDDHTFVVMSWSTSGNPRRSELQRRWCRLLGKLCRHPPPPPYLAGTGSPPAGIASADPAPPISCGLGCHCDTWNEGERERRW